MPTPWRVTPTGERQWKGDDGVWRSEHPQTVAPAPTIYRRATKAKRKATPASRRLAVVAVWAVAMLWLGTHIGADWAIFIGIVGLGTVAAIDYDNLKSRARRQSDEAAYRPHVAGGETVQVREYSTAAEYQQDAQRRVAAGWTIAGQTGERGGLNPGRTLAKGVVFLPWAVLSPSRKKGAVTVTWVRNGRK